MERRWKHSNGWHSTAERGPNRKPGGYLHLAWKVALPSELWNCISHRWLLSKFFSPEFQLNSREILKWKPLHGEKETHPFPSKQRAHSVVLCWGSEEQGAVAVAMVGRAVSAGIFLGVLFL